jgi:hypothetical protein
MIKNRYMVSTEWWDVRTSKNGKFNTRSFIFKYIFETLEESSKYIEEIMSDDKNKLQIIKTEDDVISSIHGTTITISQFGKIIDIYECE